VELLVREAQAVGYQFVDAKNVFGVLEGGKLRSAQLEIENRRRAIAWATREQMEIHPSQTLTDEVMGKANPAERAWLEAVSDDLQALSLDIYGRQAHHDFVEHSGWMALNGDEDSKFHYDRMRGVSLPGIEPSADSVLRGAFEAHPEVYGRAEAEDLSDYASPFPWHPAAPTMNGMLPAGMTAEEKAYITEHYDENDPIRLPWTVVEEAAGSRKDLVEGLGGKRYRVTNMVAHPAYADYFSRVVSALRRSVADSAVDGHDLDPSFKSYIGTAADAIERGDFASLLKADMAQTEGNLFFTFFPHEGYWPDGIKFPFMMDIGIREPLGAPSAADAKLAAGLEARAVAAARKHGLPYEGRAVGSDGAAEETVLFWMYRSGGFMRAFPREPLGHDYPKREYPGISGHRTIIPLDSTVAVLPGIRGVMTDLVDSSGSMEMRTGDMLDFIEWHERTHGTGARPDTPTDTGRSMSDVYGDFWGTIAEPLADAGSILTVRDRFEAGLMDKETHDRRIMSAIAQQLRRYYPKEAVLGPRLFGNAEASHVVGSSMMLGYLITVGAIVPDESGKSMKIDVDKVVGGIEDFFERLTVFSMTDDLEGLKAFVKQTVNAIPDHFEATVLAAMGRHIKPQVVNRNPDKKQRKTRVL
jgi:hypothetical protein